ncbi:Eco57I restriction-modification methylase domain-containing protein [Sphingomonas asaccharolytica]|uniref:Eco57I restriction-modification methylase domain-containing protein n=1 Tax=Sphingomonas asaccharolytica TaxID=40681 RepID=UPI000833E5CB|nr:hypothetical protein [Sphingomonas asaccharolytica]
MKLDLIPATASTTEALHISADWRGEDISLYLDRCQVDTPQDLVAATWRAVEQRRAHIGTVVDFGAGDGRFARQGRYASYLGYEIDWNRCASDTLPANARIVHRCAFSDVVENADLAIGNPPFVRNQDLPAGWRQKVAEQLEARSGVALSGLANAWQYFFLLSLLSVSEDGLCAIVIPYEWVSRPSAARLRDYIRSKGWNVDVYRIADATFGGVLTTSAITIVDKRDATGRWRYFADDGSGGFQQLLSESGSACGHIPYRSARSTSPDSARAVRGLSPGSQQIFTLTEAQRARYGLAVEQDVIRCVTSLRHFPPTSGELDEEAFDRHFRYAGQRCWLLNVADEPSARLHAYLDSIDDDAQQATSTCRERPVWWKFKMPPVPDLLVATSFKGPIPKICSNSIGARAVGGVAGIYGLTVEATQAFMTAVSDLDIRDRIVAHANGLRKIEINQLNALLAEVR